MRYTKYTLERDKRKKRRKIVRLFLVIALILGLMYVVKTYLIDRPKVEGLESLSLIPESKEVVLKVSPRVKEARLSIVQEGKEVVLYDAPPSKEGIIKVKLSPKEQGLRDGDAEAVLKLRYGLFGTKSYQIKTHIDTIPPKLELIAYTPSLTQGSSGAVKVKVDGGSKAVVYVGDTPYPTYSVGKGEFFTLYPIKVDEEPSTPIKVVAYDEAGNSTVKVLSVKIQPVNYKVDKIQVSEEFINKVKAELLKKELPPEEAVREVNEVWRKRDVSKLKEIGSKSIDKKLWSGVFIQLPKSKVISTFGDIRYYYYNRKEVSQSRHMGYDFASVEKAPVPASNNGVVVFAGDLGIYGNTVIIDHGLGLMSLYGHLSEILVKEGDKVKKGDLIGRTGKTGLAFGDHLHFGILVHGVEVQPKDWLDERWIKSRIESVLEAR